MTPTQNYLLALVDKCSQNALFALEKGDVSMAAFWTNAMFGFGKRMRALLKESDS